MRIVLCNLMIGLLLYCSIVAANWGIASVLVYRIDEKLARWSGHKNDDWNEIRLILNKALSGDPGNADYLHKLGSSYESEFSYYPLGNLSAEGSRRKAYNYYIQSLEMRPVWPHHWIDLALVKYRLNELDDEYYSALEKAIMLGPWEPWVQRLAADMGMHNWDNLPADIQSMIKETIRNGVRQRDDPRPMLELVKRYDMFELVCDDEVYNQLTKNYCIRHGYEGVKLIGDK